MIANKVGIDRTRAIATRAGETCSAGGAAPKATAPAATGADDSGHDVGDDHGHDS